MQALSARSIAIYVPHEPIIQPMVTLVLHLLLSIHLLLWLLFLLAPADFVAAATTLSTAAYMHQCAVRIYISLLLSLLLNLLVTIIYKLVLQRMSC